MKTPGWIGMACLLAVASVRAGDIYRCETDQGVVFSQTPCEENAEKLDIKTDSAGRAHTESAAGDDPIPDAAHRRPPNTSA